ncbi:MAG TPA: hypothetical protein VFR51_01220 [Pyrinomonadaceae bacterium]|nr:hypothetical protein [Pyrinomonadaceae bacterium]
MNWKRVSYSLSIAIVITAVAYVVSGVVGGVLLMPGVIAGLVVHGALMIVADEFIFAWPTSAALLVNTMFYTGLIYGVLSLIHYSKIRNFDTVESGAAENLQV